MEEFLWSWNCVQEGKKDCKLTSNLAWYGVRATDLVTPETTPNRHDGKFGKDDCATNGCGNFLRALNPQSNVTIVVADSNEGLEAGALTGAGLLLDGHDLQNLVLKGSAQVEVDDFKLLKEYANVKNRQNIIFGVSR
jgi:hypothetical protein